MTGPAVIVVGIAALALLLGVSPTIRPARIEPAPAHVPGRVARRRADRQIALIDVIERTSRDVRSGSGLRPALIDALQHHPALLPTLRDQLGRGAPLPQTLAQAGAAQPTDTAFVLHGLRLAAETGGSMADTLDRVVAVVRERLVWRGERHAQAAQARLSARMLTALPMAVAVWGAASGPRVRHAYAHSPTAGVLTAIGIVLNLTGWWWMHRLVRGSHTG